MCSAFCQHAFESESCCSVLTTWGSKEASIATISSNNNMVAMVKQFLSDINCACGRLESNRGIHTLAWKKRLSRVQETHSRVESLQGWGNKQCSIKLVAQNSISWSITYVLVVVGFSWYALSANSACFRHSNADSGDHIPWKAQSTRNLSNHALLNEIDLLLSHHIQYGLSFPSFRTSHTYQWISPFFGKSYAWTSKVGQNLTTEKYISILILSGGTRQEQHGDVFSKCSNWLQARVPVVCVALWPFESPENFVVFTPKYHTVTKNQMFRIE